MTKLELIKEVAKRHELFMGDAEEAINGVFELIIEALSKGEEVKIEGFGTFKTAQIPARTGYNVRTGEPVPVPEFKAVYFRAYKALKQVVK